VASGARERDAVPDAQVARERDAPDRTPRRIDDGKPLPCKQGLSTAEREELVRLHRQLRQVQMERDILAKATAWFAGRSDATSTKSSDS